MERVTGMLRGGWFPENWDVPVAIGLGVVVTGFMGDTIAGFISQWIPAEWLNPASEFIAGLVLFMLGGAVGGQFSTWIRLFSFGAFAVAVADTLTILLGLGAAPAAAAVQIRTVQTANRAAAVARGIPGATY